MWQWAAGTGDACSAGTCTASQFCNMDFTTSGFCEACPVWHNCSAIGLPAGGVADCESYCSGGNLTCIADCPSFATADAALMSADVASFCPIVLSYPGDHCLCDCEAGDLAGLTNFTTTLCGAASADFRNTSYCAAAPGTGGVGGLPGDDWHKESVAGVCV